METNIKWKQWSVVINLIFFQKKRKETREYINISKITKPKSSLIYLKITKPKSSLIHLKITKPKSSLIHLKITKPKSSLIN